MNTNSALLIAALLLIVKPLAALPQTATGNGIYNTHQSAPASGKITIISNNLSGDSVSIAYTNNRTTVILTKHHEEGSLDLNLDQIQVNNTSGKSMSDKVVINILSISQFEIDLSALPSGVYVIKTKTGSVTIEKK
jgi:hypothetical protein